MKNEIAALIKKRIERVKLSEERQISAQLIVLMTVCGLQRFYQLSDKIEATINFNNGRIWLYHEGRPIITK